MKPNKHIEDWATRREHLEHEFKWDGKTLANIGIWAFAFPYFVYTMWCAGAALRIGVPGSLLAWFIGRQCPYTQR